MHLPRAPAANPSAIKAFLHYDALALQADCHSRKIFVPTSAELAAGGPILHLRGQTDPAVLAIDETYRTGLPAFSAAYLSGLGLAEVRRLIRYPLLLRSPHQTYQGRTSSPSSSSSYSATRGCLPQLLQVIVFHGTTFPQLTQVIVSLFFFKSVSKAESSIARALVG